MGLSVVTLDTLRCVAQSSQSCRTNVSEMSPKRSIPFAQTSCRPNDWWPLEQPLAQTCLRHQNTMIWYYWKGEQTAVNSTKSYNLAVLLGISELSVEMSQDAVSEQSTEFHRITLVFVSHMCY